MSSTRKILIVLLTLILVTFGAWVALRKRPTPSPQNTPIVVPTKSFVVNMPDKALLRNYVEVSVEAAPETSCELTFVPPAGNSRRTVTTAGASGLCIWKWQLEESDGKGNARLIFTINGISETHFLEVRSAF